MRRVEKFADPGRGGCRERVSEGGVRKKGKRRGSFSIPANIEGIASGKA